LALETVTKVRIQVAASATSFRRRKTQAPC